MRIAEHFEQVRGDVGGSRGDVIEGDARGLVGVQQGEQVSRLLGLPEPVQIEFVHSVVDAVEHLGRRACSVADLDADDLVYGDAAQASTRLLTEMTAGSLMQIIQALAACAVASDLQVSDQQRRGRAVWTVMRDTSAGEWVWTGRGNAPVVLLN